MLIASRWTMESLFGCYMSQPSLGKISSLSNTPVARSSYMDSKDMTERVGGRLQVIMRTPRFADGTPQPNWWSGGCFHNTTDWGSSTHASQTSMNPTPRLCQEHVSTTAAAACELGRFNWKPCEGSRAQTDDAAGKKGQFCQTKKSPMSIRPQLVRGHHRREHPVTCRSATALALPELPWQPPQPQIKSRRGLETWRTAAFCRRVGGGRVDGDLEAAAVGGRIGILAHEIRKGKSGHRLLRLLLLACLRSVRWIHGGDLQELGDTRWGWTLMAESGLELRA
jgi:hypothetical protein